MKGEHVHAWRTTPDYDSPWKDVLERYFEQFIEFFFPAIRLGAAFPRSLI